jgi:hypothetical protein
MTRAGKATVRVRDIRRHPRESRAMERWTQCGSDSLAYLIPRHISSSSKTRLDGMIRHERGRQQSRSSTATHAIHGWWSRVYDAYYLILPSTFLRLYYECGSSVGSNGDAMVLEVHWFIII